MTRQIDRHDDADADPAVTAPATARGEGVDPGFEAEVEEFLRGHPPKRFHRSGEMQLFSSDMGAAEFDAANMGEGVTAGSAGAEPPERICNSCTAPAQPVDGGRCNSCTERAQPTDGGQCNCCTEAGPMADDARCNCCTASRVRSAEQGEKPSAAAPEEGGRRIGPPSPRGPVTGYDPGRLAGVLPGGTIIHTNYSGLLYRDGEAVPKGREAVRPPLPRAIPSLDETLEEHKELARRCQRGRQRFEAAKPALRELGGSHREVRVRYPRIYEESWDHKIFEAAQKDQLSRILFGLAQDEEIVLHVARKVLKQRYGKDVRASHVREVAERARSWEAAGEKIATDIWRRADGVVEPIAAYGDVAHVRQEIVRMLMSAAGKARGVIRGSDDVALRTLVAGLAEEGGIILTLNPGRWFHALLFAELWQATGVAGALRTYGIECHDVGESTVIGDPCHLYAESLYGNILEILSVVGDTHFKPRCCVGNAAASEAFVQLLSYAFRKLKPAPLICLEGALVVFRGLAQARAGAKAIDALLHHETAVWLPIEDRYPCEASDRGNGSRPGASNDQIMSRARRGPGPAPIRLRVFERASAWHDFAPYRFRRADCGVIIEPSIASRHLFFRNLLEKLQERPRGAAELYVRRWPNSLALWNGGSVFAEMVLAGLPEVRSRGRRDQRAALARCVARAFRETTGRPLTPDPHFDAPRVDV